MVFALAGDSTTTSVLPLARAVGSPSLLAFALVFRALAVFAAAALLVAMSSSGRRSMPALPIGFESSAAQEIFPGPLHDHALHLQLRQLSQRFPGRDLRAEGEVVYMSRGPLVQKSPEFRTRRVDDFRVRAGHFTARVGCRKARMRCVIEGRHLRNGPLQAAQDVRGTGRQIRLPIAQQIVWPLGE